MSSSIDDRIVKMSFDNAKFEKGITESSKSLEKFKKELDFTESKRKFRDLENAAEDVSFNHIVDGIEEISKRFSNMGIIGMRVLENIADKAFTAGERLVSSLTVDQIGSGFNKYEDKTKAVQTIINATGASMDEVDEQLSKLAWFTDETSYNFVDMVSNIGKFTSMGIKLDTSVTAMEGIANWAALSGQGVNEASRAMYNLAQAIGAGSVKLMDWRSIENANMGTKEFKETAIATAKALGVLNKQGKTSKGTIVGINNFSQTLSEGWFTKDVLLKTLEQYGEYANEVYKVASEEGITAAEAMKKVGDEAMKLGSKAFRAAQEAKTFAEAIEATKDAVSTGWMNTFELVFGNYEEARELWTDLANDLYEIFAGGAEHRNELLQEWKEKGGRDDLISGLSDAMKVLITLIDQVKEAFHDIFPETTADNLLNLSNRVKDFGQNLKESFGITQKLSKVYKRKKWIDRDPLEDLTNELKKGDKSEAVKLMQERLMKLGYKLDGYGADGVFGPETQAALNEFKKQYGLTIDGIYDETTHKALGEALGLGNGKIFDGYERVEEYVDVLPPKLQYLRRVLSGVFSVASIGSKIVNFLVKVGKKVVNTFEPFTNAALVFIDAASRFFETLNERIGKSNVFDKWLMMISRDLVPVNGLIEKLSKAFLKFLGIEGDLDKVDFNKTIDIILEKLQPFLSIIRTIYVIAKSTINIFSTIAGFVIQVGKRLLDVLSPIWDMFSKIFLAGVKLFEAFGRRFVLFSNKISNSNKFEEWLTKLDTILPDVKTKIEAFTNSVLSFLGLSGDLDKIDFDAVIENIVNSIKNFFGLGIDSSSFGDVIDSEQAVKSIKDKIISIYTSIKDWIISLFKSDNDSQKAGELNFDGYKIALAAISAVIAAISTRLLQVVGVVVKAGKNVNGILKNIKGITSRIKNKKLVTEIGDVGKAVLNFALAIGVLAGAVFLLSKLSWEELAKGLVSVAAIIGMLIGSMAALSAVTKNFKNIDNVMKALDMFALAVLGMGVTVLMLSKLSWDELARGMVGVISVIAVAIGTLFLLSKMKMSANDVSGTIGLIGTLALTIGNFADVVKRFGSMDTNNLVKGFVSMSAVLLAISLFIRSLSKGTQIKASTVLGILSTALAIDLVIGGFLIMSYAMKLLTPTDILKGMAGMIAIVLSMSLFMKLISKMNPKPSAILSLLPLAVALDLVIIGFIGLLMTLKTATPSDILKALAGMALVVVSIAGLMALIKNIKPSIRSILALVPVAVSLDLVILGFIGLVYAMKHVAPSDILKSLAGIGIIILGLMATLKIMEHVRPKVGAILALIPVALALDLAVAGFMVLALAMKRLNWDDLKKAFVSFMVVVGALSLMSVALSLTTPSIKSSVTTLMSSIALIGAMVAFALVLRSVKDVKTKKIVAFASGLSKILLAFAGLTIATSIGGFKGVLAAGAAILVIGAAIGMLVAAIAAILNQPGVSQYLENGAEKLGKIIGSFTGAMKAAEFRAFSDGMKGFEDVDEPNKDAINNVLECARLLSEFSESLPRSYKIGALLELFTSASPLTQFADDIVGFAEGFNAFSAMMQGVNYTDDLSTNTQSAVYISESLRDLSESLPDEYKMGPIAAWFKNTSPLSTFSKDIAGFANSFNDFALMMSGISNTDDLSEKTTSAVHISESLRDLSASLPDEYKVGPIVAWFENTSPLATFSKDIVGYAKSFNDYALMISKIDDTDSLANKTKSAVYISESLRDLSTSLPSEYKVGPIAAWFKNTSPLSTFADDISDFAKSFNNYALMMGRITDTGSLADKTKSAVHVSESLRDLSTSLPDEYKVGPIAAWFKNTSPLSTFSDDIAEFAKSFNNFALMMAGVTETGDLSNKTESAVNISNSLSGLSEHLPSVYKANGISLWFSNNSPLSTFSKDIAGFALGFNNFSLMMQGVSQSAELDEKTKWASGIASSMSSLSTNLPDVYKRGKIVAWLGSSSPLTDFTEDMVRFAKGFEYYRQMMENVKKTNDLTEKTTWASRIASSIASLASSLPSEYKKGKIEGWLTGDSPLKTFTEDMVDFASGFDKYADEIDKIKFNKRLDDKTERASTIASSIASLASSLPSEYKKGKIEGWLTGDSPLKTFTEDMVDFASGFDIFGEAMSRITVRDSIKEKSDTAVEVANAISGLATNLPGVYSSSVITKWFTRSESPLSSFGTDMTWFATKFNNFITEMGRINYTEKIETDTNNAIKIASNVGNFLKDLASLGIEKNSGFIRSLFENETSQKTVFDSISDLVTSVSGSARAFSEFSAAGAARDMKFAIEAAQKMAEFMSYVGQEDISQNIANAYWPIDEIRNALNREQGSISAMLHEFSDSVADIENIEALAASIQSIVDLSNLLIVNKYNGESSTNGGLLIGLVSIIDDTLVYLRNCETDFYDAGYNFIMGLANGINENSSLAIQASRDVAGAMLAAAMETLDENSPSKEAEEIGENYSIGLSKGVKKFSYAAENSSADLASSMLSMASGTLATLSQLLAQDIECDPVISPVIDLTSFNSAVASMDSAFGDRSIGFSARTNMTSQYANYASESARLAALASANYEAARGARDGGLNGYEGVETINQSFTNVDTSISNLNDRIASLEYAISNMKVVTETGALIGQIRTGMDIALGEMSYQNERGM